MYTIRLAREAEVDLLPPIETEAGSLFIAIGMADVAQGQPTGVEEHRAGCARGQLWVAAGGDDRPVGFALVKELDGCVYLEEISVHPDHGRRGLGARLLDAVADYARSAGLPAVTLSTFRDVAWNGPWYRAYGFRTLREDELTSGLLEVRRREAASGLDVGARCFMRLEAVVRR